VEILLVTELYPPIAHTEAFCTGKLAKALLARGHGVRVVTTPPGYWREHVVDRSPAWGGPLGEVVAPAVPSSRIARRAADAAARLRARTPGVKGWHEAARRAALALARERRVDLVMTRYNATRTAWVGRALKRELDVPWVAYFPDPTPRFLAPPPYGAGRARGVSERWEGRRARAWLGEADALAFPCERLARYTTRALGLEGKPIVVLPHVGWRSERPPPPPDAIQVLHAGFFTQHRYADAFLEGLAAAARRARERGLRFRVDFLGETKDEAPRRLLEARGLSDVVGFPGLAWYEESLAWMRAATALLLLEVPMAEGVYLPSKWCDYALSGRPVLAFSPATGTIADALGPGHPSFLGQSAAGATEGLLRFLDAAATGRDADLDPWRFDGTSRYGADAVVTSFEQQVARLLDPGPRSPRP
jgi:glycosyltransferase involved in cell wall biosynthesis